MAGARTSTHTHTHACTVANTWEGLHKPQTTCAIALLYLLRLHLTLRLFRSSFRKLRLGARASPSCTNLKPAAHWVTKSTQTQQSTTGRVQWIVYYHSTLFTSAISADMLYYTYSTGQQEHYIYTTQIKQLSVLMSEVWYFLVPLRENCKWLTVWYFACIHLIQHYFAFLVNQVPTFTD